MDDWGCLWVLTLSSTGAIPNRGALCPGSRPGRFPAKDRASFVPRTAGKPQDLQGHGEKYRWGADRPGKDLEALWLVTGFQLCPERCLDITRIGTPSRNSGIQPAKDWENHSQIWLNHKGPGNSWSTLMRRWLTLGLAGQIDKAYP